MRKPVVCTVGDVQFYFWCDDAGKEFVHVIIGSEKREMSLGTFCQGMQYVSAVAASRSYSAAKV